MPLISPLSLIFAFIFTVVPGLFIAAALGQEWWSGSWWATLALAFSFSAFIIQWIQDRFFIPISGATEVPGRNPRFSEEVRDARWNFCAVSSKWLSLWQTPSFTYFMHVNTTKALIGYSHSVRSPLGKISADDAEKKAFYEKGFSLAEAIGRGESVPSFYGLRLLVYPSHVYDNPKWREQIESLIQSHTMGRVHCIPMVLERLLSSIKEGEKEDLRAFSEQLEQKPEDNFPPRSRAQRIWDRFCRRTLMVVPDFLIVDNLKSPSADEHVWWYSGTVQKSDPNLAEQASRTFEILCSKAAKARWDGYTSATVGDVPTYLPTSYTSEETFFSFPYFDKWLGWIQTTESLEAEALKKWLEKEDEWLIQNVPEKAKVLDVGCGFGRHAQLLLDRCKPGCVTGIDINVSMINRARELVKVYGREKLKFYVDDAAELACCNDNEFDVVVCMTNTLGNINPEKQKACLEQIKRVVKPGGKILISVYSILQGTRVRLRSYEAVGLHMVEKDNAMSALEGLRSEHFSRTILVKLLESSGLAIEREPSDIDKIGLAVVAAKK